MDKELQLIPGREYFEMSLHRLGGALVTKQVNWGGPIDRVSLEYSLNRAVKELVKDFMHADPPPIALRPGDIVKLRSGGPDMTVVRDHGMPLAAPKSNWFTMASSPYNSRCGVECAWVDGGIFSNSFFPAACLSLQPEQTGTGQQP